MKKIGLLFLVTVLATVTFSQDPVQLPMRPDDLVKKAKSQKAAGWVLSSLGVGGLLTTLVAEAGHDLGGALATVFSGGTVRPERKSFAIPYVASAAVLVGGISFLSASSKTKRSVKDVSHFFTIERTEVVQRSGLRQHALPVAGIRIAL